MEYRVVGEYGIGLLVSQFVRFYIEENFFYRKTDLPSPPTKKTVGLGVFAPGSIFQIQWKKNFIK